MVRAKLTRWVKFERVKSRKIMYLVRKSNKNRCFRCKTILYCVTVKQTQVVLKLQCYIRKTTEFGLGCVQQGWTHQKIRPLCIFWKDARATTLKCVADKKTQHYSNPATFKFCFLMFSKHFPILFRFAVLSHLVDVFMRFTTLKKMIFYLHTRVNCILVDHARKRKKNTNVIKRQVLLYCTSDTMIKKCGEITAILIIFRLRLHQYCICVTLIFTLSFSSISALTQQKSQMTTDVSLTILAKIPMLNLAFLLSKVCPLLQLSHHGILRAVNKFSTIMVNKDQK